MDGRGPEDDHGDTGEVGDVSEKAAEPGHCRDGDDSSDVGTGCGAGRFKAAIDNQVRPTSRTALGCAHAWQKGRHNQKSLAEKLSNVEIVRFNNWQFLNHNHHPFRGQLTTTINYFFYRELCRIQDKLIPIRTVTNTIVLLCFPSTNVAGIARHGLAMLAVIVTHGIINS